MQGRTALRIAAIERPVQGTPNGIGRQALCAQYVMRAALRMLKQSVKHNPRDSGNGRHFRPKHRHYFGAALTQCTSIRKNLVI